MCYWGPGFSKQVQPGWVLSVEWYLTLVPCLSSLSGKRVISSVFLDSNDGPAGGMRFCRYFMVTILLRRQLFVCLFFFLAISKLHDCSVGSLFQTVVLWIRFEQFYMFSANSYTLLVHSFIVVSFLMSHGTWRGQWAIFRWKKKHAILLQNSWSVMRVNMDALLRQVFPVLFSAIL